MNVKTRVPDADIQAAQDRSAAWGMEAVIDLHDCSLTRLQDPATYHGFMADLLAAIDMNAYGDLWLNRFGKGDLEGITAIQPIETSSVTIHADEPGRQCMLNVFSCRAFDPAAAAAVAVRHFGGQAELTVRQRGTRPHTPEAAR